MHFEAEAQKGNISGSIQFQNEPLPFVSVFVQGTEFGTISDENGRFQIEKIPFGTYELVISFVGFVAQKHTVTLSKSRPHYNLLVHLEEQSMSLETIVVTGFKTPKRQTDAPIIVNVLDSKTLENTQSCNLSEGLKFQPGLRVETDCQTCNYTQLRINGLPGGYSQILINGRPIFNPLTGLYGMVWNNYRLI